MHKKKLQRILNILLEQKELVEGHLQLYSFRFDNDKFNAESKMMSKYYKNKIKKVNAAIIDVKTEIISKG